MATQDDSKVEAVTTDQANETMDQDVLAEAREAAEKERSETFWQTIKNNPKAVMWSMLISQALIMEAYGIILMGNFFAYPEFQKKYGQDFGGQVGYQVSAPWQTGLGMASTAGTIVGGILNGYLCARFGYRWVMIIGLFFMNAFIFIVFFAPSAPVLLVGQILCGLPWGIFPIVGPAYASEVCPTNLRAYMTTYVGMCWAIGQLLSAGVLKALIQRTDQWAYRIPFALQWIWPLPLMVVCFFAPESPWYLVRNGRLDDAKRSLERLSSKSKSQDQINGQLAMMLHTIKMESEKKTSHTYMDCFRGVNLRRTEIACMTFAGQILAGSTLAYVPTYFFVTAGMSADDAYKLNLGGTALALLGTLLSWWLITYHGRRIIYVTGQGVLCVLLFMIGILNASSSTDGSLWAQCAFCIFWIFVYSLTIGSITYAIVSETSSVHLRSLSVSLARVAYQVSNIVSQVLQPYFMNPTAWNASGKTAFFWGGTALLTFVWAYFRLPEAKGRTYAELDILFARRVPARQFASTKVDAYEEANGDSPTEENEKS